MDRQLFRPTERHGHLSRSAQFWCKMENWIENKVPGVHPMPRVVSNEIFIAIAWIFLQADSALV